MVIWMGLFVTAQGQLISVKPELSSDSMMIGEQMVYTLHVEAAADLDFRMPAFKDTLADQLEILALQGTDTIREGDRISVNHHYLFTAFEGGMHLIPAPRIEYTFRGLIDTALGMPLVIAVYEPEVDTTLAIRPIKAPINTPLSFREVLPWAGLGLAAVALGILGWFLVNRYVRKRKVIDGMPAGPMEPPHVLAFRELDQLKEAKLWEQGRVKEYYSRLTEISRRYIERQYGIPAMERTSFEILQAFRQANRGDMILDEMLKDLLELADLVKFAKEDPLPVDNRTHLNNAYIFVQKTYPHFIETAVEEEREAEVQVENHPGGKDKGEPGVSGTEDGRREQHG